jgi:hypothetical protein
MRLRLGISSRNNYKGNYLNIVHILARSALIKGAYNNEWEQRLANSFISFTLCSGSIVYRTEAVFFQKGSVEGRERGRKRVSSAQKRGDTLSWPALKSRISAYNRFSHHLWVLVRLVPPLNGYHFTPDSDRISEKRGKTSYCRLCYLLLISTGSALSFLGEETLPYLFFKGS